jgi:hypothetical protein
MILDYCTILVKLNYKFDNISCNCLFIHSQLKIHIINFFKMAFQSTISQQRHISDEIILSLKGVDLFPKKIAKAKEILQKAKIPTRVKSKV